MKRIKRSLKDISLSSDGFIFSPSLVVFIMIVSVLSGFNICLDYKLETVDNINILSDKVLLETEIINRFKCLLLNDEIDDFMIDDVYIEVIADGDEYNLFYNDSRIGLIVDGYRIISADFN